MSAELRLAAWAAATALLFGLAGPGSAHGQEATPARELALPPLPPQLAPAADATAPWNADLRALRDRLADPLRVPQADGRALLPAAVGSAPCPVADALPEPLALSDAIAAALCLNPQWRASAAAVQVQAAGVGEARAAYLPRVNLGLGRLRTATSYPDMEGADSAAWGSTRQATANWRVWDFGARSANLGLADRLLEAALANRDATLQRLLGDLTSRYYDAQTARAAERAQQEAVALARNSHASALRREARGAAAAIDTLQARSALAKAELMLARSRGQTRQAQVELVHAIGLPAASVLVLPDTLDTMRPDDPGELSLWLTEVQQHHPAVAAARAQVEAARARADATRAEGLPTLDLNGSWYANGYPNQGLSSLRTRVATMGLTLSIPLFEGWSRDYKLKGAQAQVAQAEAGLQQALGQAAFDVAKAHAGTQAALAGLRHADELLDAARAAHESAGRRYERGVGDITELLNTQGAYNEARYERLRTLAEWHAARLVLLAAAGVLNTVDARQTPTLPR